MDGSSAGGRLREVYAVAYPRLVGQLVGVTGDPAEAEDAVMEAFARAAPGRSSFHDADNPEALAAHRGRQRGAQSLATGAALDPPGPRAGPLSPGLMNGPIYSSDDDGRTWTGTTRQGNESRQD